MSRISSGLSRFLPASERKGARVEHVKMNTGAGVTTVAQFASTCSTMRTTAKQASPAAQPALEQKQKQKQQRKNGNDAKETNKVESGSCALFYNPKQPPLAALVAASLTQELVGKDNLRIVPKGDLTCVRLLETKEDFAGNEIAIRYIGRLCDSTGKRSLYGGGDFAVAMQIDFILNIVEREMTNGAGLSSVLERLDKHLSTRTYLVNDSWTIADFALWEALLLNKQWQGMTRNSVIKFVNLNRWYFFCQLSPVFSSAIAAFDKVNPSQQPKVVVDKKTDKTKSVKEKKQEVQEEDRYIIELPGAEEGKVVTRFPPEPSGYLHIGHAKAAMLNHYFARKYKGKLILRFDDTNPEKENQDFVDNILADLKTLEIDYDIQTHTSDHFDRLLQICTEMIQRGEAYVDDTDPKQMQRERKERIPSKNRNADIQRNMELWKEMQNGTDKGQECCVRAKIDYQSDNGTLRDPVMYRCNVDCPHHRTGTKYKVYPTYDFACPLVDSWEGVTHTLRTMEYHDRDEQYRWFQQTLNVRKCHIWEYSRLNMIFTLMSKRKLQWFVDEERVQGWNDPRFPTIQGIIRRGLTVQGLRTFIKSQGASQAESLQHWDKIWSFNAKVLDPIVPRYSAVSRDKNVTITLTDISTTEEKDVQLHPKYHERGLKKVIYSREILIESIDADEVKEGEEVTLLNWGNVIIDRIVKDSSSKHVVSIEAHTNLKGDFKTTKKKLHWVPKINGLVNVTSVQVDHLLTVPNLEDDQDFKDFIRENSWIEESLLGEPAMRAIQQGDHTQLVRRGFHRRDNNNNDKICLIFVPDGKEKNMSVVQNQISKTGVKKEK